VVAAALRLGGLAMNNIVVIDAATTPLLYALPLSAMLAALMLMERARRRLSTSRFPGILLDPIVDGFVWIGGLLRRRPAPRPSGRR
jgi:lipopolysaccharide export system permease protein